MRLRMPSFLKNCIIAAVDLETMARGIEHADAWDVDVSTGLTFASSGAGKKLGLSLPDGLAYMKVTSLPAGDGATSLGHGTGQVMSFTEGASGSAAGTLAVAADAPKEDIYSLANGTIKAGATIIAGRIGNAWHFLFTICTNGS